MTRSRLPAGLLLVALAVAFMLPALGAGFIWDDDQAITENPLLGSPEGLRTIWTEPSRIPQRHYWPLVYTTFWMEHRLWGLDPTGYHLVNLLLHAANSVLVWVLLRRIGVPGAWFAGALFAVHPVHVESVAWIIERKDVLSGFFYLASALLFVIHRERRSGPFYAGSLVLFVCAMLSKSMAVTLPVALLLWSSWANRRITLRDLLETLPFLGVGAALALFDVAVSKGEVVPSGLGVLERVVLAGRVAWFYAGKVVWPADLIAIYPRWSIDATSVASYLAPASLAGSLAVLAALRTPAARGALFGILFFLVTLSPLLGFVDYEYMIHSFVADRYLYLPSLGLIAVLAAGAIRLSRRAAGLSGHASRVSGRAVRSRRLAGALAAAVLLFLGGMTWSRARDFQDLETLFGHTLARNPEAFAAHNNLAAHLAEEGRFAVAEHHFREALRIRPDYPVARNGLAYVLVQQGRLKEAVAEYRELIRLRPDYGDAYNNLGATLIRTGRVEEAVEVLGRALELDPGSRETRLNLAQAHLAAAGLRVSAGDTAGARPHLEASLRLDPSNLGLRIAYARLLVREGRTDEARAQYRLVLEADPGNAVARRELQEIR